MTTATMPATTPGLKWSDQHQAALNGRAMLGNAGATVNADGRDSVWVRATDNTLQSIPLDSASGAWSSWRQEPGVIGGDPAPLLGADGLIRVFFRSPDNNLFVITQKQTSGYFDDPVLLTSGCASDPSVAMNMDGCFTVIYRGSNNAVWQVSHNARSYTTWGKPSTLGGSVTGRPVVARDGAGKLTVLAIGGDTGIWTVNQTAINNTTTWSQWMSLGGATASELFAAKWADQRVAVFYTGGDGAVYTYAQQPNYVFQGVPSANHTRLGATVVGRPSAALAADGRLAVFATSKQQPQLLVADQTTVNGSAFSAFAGLGGNLSGDGTPVETGPWLLTVGVLDCFYRGINNNELWYQAQTTA